MDSPCIIWHLSDGKTGHVNQVRGLVRALGKWVNTESHLIDLDTSKRWRMFRWWLTGRFPPGEGLPDPTLIVAAGHRTHPAMLAARRARGGRTVVLMAPQMPRRWFDLCFIPEHDCIKPADNVIITRGVLNVVDPSDEQSPNIGLMLIGGPSLDFDWSTMQLVEQVRAIVGADEAVMWTLTTSRRTPKDTTAALAGIESPNLNVVPVEQTDHGWVAAHLAQAAQAWVTEDSVSMIYEALTAGAAVGLLAVPRARTRRRIRGGTPRTYQGLEKLSQEGWLMMFEQWQQRGRLQPPPQRLAEAPRCAEIVYERLLKPTRSDA